MSFADYFIRNYYDVLFAFGEHFRLVLIAVILATTIGIPLGLLFSKHPKANKIFEWLNGFFVMIPALALFGLVIPLAGVGFITAVIGLALYAVFPIIKQTYIGISKISSSSYNIR